MPNNKYNQLKRQYSLDGGLTWHDLLPMVYKVGNVIETNSNCTDSDGCRWVVLPITEAYDCDSNYNMYQIEAEECLNEFGVFVRSGNIRRYRLIEDYSLACGYSGPICTPTTITSYSYDIVYNGGAVEYNQVATPVVYQITTTIETDKGCNEISYSTRKQIYDYGITYSPNDFNYTESDRTVTATVSYSGATIGSFDYIQKCFYSKPVDVDDKVLYSSTVNTVLYDDCSECRFNRDGYEYGGGRYVSTFKDKFIVSSYFAINTETSEKKIYDTRRIISTILYSMDTNLNGLGYFFRDKLIQFNQPVLEISTPLVFNENNMTWDEIINNNHLEFSRTSFFYTDYLYTLDDYSYKIINRIDSNLNFSEVELFYDEIQDLYWPKSELKQLDDGLGCRIIYLKNVGFSIYAMVGEWSGFKTGNRNYTPSLFFINDELICDTITDNGWISYTIVNDKYLFFYDYLNNTLHISYDNKYIRKENFLSGGHIEMYLGNGDNASFFFKENELWLSVHLDRALNRWMKYDFSTMECEIDYETDSLNNYLVHQERERCNFHFYSSTYDLYFDFDNTYSVDGEIKPHFIDFRSYYDCTYYLMGFEGTAVLVKHILNIDGNNHLIDDYECLKGYTNAKEVAAYFDANYEKVNDSTRLSFEFDGESCYYRMNSKSYTATTSPYDVTFSDLGFTGTLTGCSSMFDSQSSLTSVIKLPDTSNVTTMKNMFNGCTNLIYLDANEIVTNNVTNMQSMYNGCKNLQTLDVSSWDVNNVTDMSFMFSGCTYITTLDLSGWNPSNVTASAMFKGCTNITTLDLSNFRGISRGAEMFKGCTNLTSISFNNSIKSLIFDMYGMFDNCTSLTSLDLSSFNTSFVTNMNHTFYNCTSLTILYLNGWDMYDVTNFAGMFDYCNNLTTIYAYGCSQTTIDKLNSAKPTNCTLVY